MKCTVLHFSNRTDAVLPYDKLRSSVEETLGCSLQFERLRGVPAYQDRVLGMHIILLEWCGIDGRDTYQLHGAADDIRYLERQQGTVEAPAGINISRAIIDLLAIYGAGEWRVPSREEIDAEIAYGREADADFEVTDEDIRKLKEEGEED